MNDRNLNRIVNFLRGIADDVLRDPYVRDKYRHVILPMTVLRGIDALLEPTKNAVLDIKAKLREPLVAQPLRRQSRGLPASRVGRRWKFAEVDAWLKRGGRDNRGANQAKRGRM